MQRSNCTVRFDTKAEQRVVPGVAEKADWACVQLSGGSFLSQEVYIQEINVLRPTPSESDKPVFCGKSIDSRFMVTYSTIYVDTFKSFT
jgi:hypothetical protein